MELEDTRDKLRRNVVLIGSLVIIFWILDLRLPASLMGFKVDPSKHGRVWWLIAILLSYAFFRFFHTEEAQLMRKEVLNQWISLRRQFIEAGFKLALKVYQKHRRSILFDLSFVGNAADELLMQAEATEILSYQTGSSEYYREGDPRRHCMVVILFKLQNGYESERKVEGARPDWPRWLKLAATLISGARVACRSWNIVNVFFPYLVAAGSAGILVLYLFRHYSIQSI